MKTLSFLTLSLFVSVSLAAQTSSGTLTANGKKTPLDHVVATRDKEGKVHVLLSNEPVTAKQILDHSVDFDLSGPDKTFSAVQVVFDKDGEIISGNFYSPQFKKQNGSFSATGMHKFEGKVTASSVDGKLFMDKEDDFFGSTYIYSAKLSVPITQPKEEKPEPLKGKALPADGGEPGKAYRAYLKTIAGGNAAQIRSAVSSTRSKSISDKDLKEFIPMLQAMAPKNLKITSGAIDGDKATLLATSKDGTETMNGTITMVKESGAWKVEQESWKN